MTPRTGFAKKDLAEVARLIATRRPKAGPLIVGVTGAVASGKSTFSAALRSALASGGAKVEIACTDGFLFPNAVLEARGLTSRKGFPETYDTTALLAALAGIRSGGATFPGYCHQTYDVDPTLARPIGGIETLIIEGLSLHLKRGALPIDVLIYIDAAEADLERWFTGRFAGFCRAARTDAGSFYARFSSLAPAQVRAFASQVWRETNLRNLREHIIEARNIADIVIEKDADHSFRRICLRAAEVAA
ncbi:MAG: type I pantothenate kinase [Caulobacteraceae bacterium]